MSNVLYYRTESQFISPDAFPGSFISIATAHICIMALLIQVNLCIPELFDDCSTR
jgi:hypothetical protein